MKIKYKILIICKKIAQSIYIFFKPFPVKNKITFISRQTNGKNLDFDLIIKELKNDKNHYKLVVLNKRLEKGLKSKIEYAFHMLVQMYHIATSKVIILDSYCILTSILKHKKQTTIIQIWHALGSLKKFGYSSLGKKEGRDQLTAKIMEMHKNNDYIITSSEFSKKYFMEAFNAEEEQMLVIGLPRIDFLKSQEEKQKTVHQFFNKYEECNNNKENILYVPTMRKNEKIDLSKIVNAVDYKRYNLIVKLHSGREIIYIDKQKIEKGIYFLGTELLHIADYIITDYSAIVYEASLIDKPIYFYTYDYDKYMSNRGVYIDFRKEMPGFISKDIKTILKYIENEKWNPDKVKKFTNKYIENKDINVTKKLVEIILKLMNNENIEKEVNEREYSKLSK